MLSTRQYRQHRVILAIVLTTLCAVPMYPQAVFAQQTPVRMHLPAQPLDQALSALARQTSLDILAPTELVAGKQAPAIAGNFTPPAALEQLLRGSGLEARSTGDSSFMVQRIAQSSTPPQPATAPMTMPPVTVQETREQGYTARNATTATKVDVPILDVPQSIQVIPRQVIEEQRALTLSDVFRNVSGFSPGVNSQSQRFGDRNSVFRGFTGNNYYTNGFKDPFNGSSFSFGLANIDSVEVLKGPSSVLYGLGEPGATINVITKQPLADWYASGAVTAGSFGLVNPSLDISGPLTPGKELRFRLNAAYQRQDSFVDFVQSERYQLAPVLALAIGPNTHLTLEGEYQAISEIYWTGLPAEGTILPNPGGKLPRSRYLGDAELEGDEFPERTLAKVGYRLEHRFNEHVALRHGFRFTYFTRDDRDIIPFGLQEDLRTFDRDLFVAQGWTTDYYILTDLVFDFTTGPLRHKLLVGSDQRFFSTSDRSATDFLDPIDIFNPTYGGLVDPIGPTTPRRLLEQSGTFIGVYLQDIVTITPQVKLLVGGRFDLANLDSETENTDTGTITDSEIDENVFTPRAGLVYQPMPSVSLYASYSQSFNPLTGATFEGDAFDPEEGVQYEGGVKFELFGGRMLSTVAIYHLTKENILTPDPVNIGFSIQEGEQRSRGIEFDISGEVLPGFRLIASYSYIQAKITESNSGNEGNRPANVPEHTGSIWGVYEFQAGLFKGLGLGLGLVGVGDRPADNENTVTLPDYVRTDLALYYQPWKHVDLALNIKNLFNIDYIETSTFGDPFAGISPGAPFSVFGTVTARY
jgi:iron complex outermembrane receptor protein